jgi:hypothetical protein
VTRFFLFLIAASIGAAQQLSVGVKVGARLTNDVEGWANSESRRYVVGPMVELRLPHRFAVEGDVLYSRLGYTSFAESPFYAVTNRVRGNVWEFPVVAKYRLGAPYLLGGYAPRRLTSTYRAPVESSSITHGLVAGGGVDLAAGRLRFSPEVRYVRWNADAIGVYGSHGFYVEGAQNEVKLLLGIAWR